MLRQNSRLSWRLLWVNLLMEKALTSSLLAANRPMGLV